MKTTSSTALLATMAAAATLAALAATLRESVANKKQSSNEVSASTSSRPGRRLDGKSGKATASASFPAKPEDYAWLVGEYESADLGLPTDYNYNQVLMDEGEPVEVFAWGMYYAAKLDIKPLRDYPSLVFQATFDVKYTESDVEHREVMEGVGSFNPGKVDEITFHSDHKESRNSPDEEWVPGLLTEYAELTTLECSKVPISTRGNYRL